MPNLSLPLNPFPAQKQPRKKSSKDIHKDPDTIYQIFQQDDYPHFWSMPRLASGTTTTLNRGWSIWWKGQTGIERNLRIACIWSFFKMPLHSFDLGNVFVTCAWTVFLLCKVFVPQRSVGEAECGRISVWLCAVRKAVVTSAMLAQASVPSWYPIGKRRLTRREWCCGCCCGCSHSFLCARDVCPKPVVCHRNLLQFRMHLLRFKSWGSRQPKKNSTTRL